MLVFLEITKALFNVLLNNNISISLRLLIALLIRLINKPDPEPFDKYKLWGFLRNLRNRILFYWNYPSALLVYVLVFIIRCTITTEKKIRLIEILLKSVQDIIDVEVL